MMLGGVPYREVDGQRIIDPPDGVEVSEDYELARLRDNVPPCLSAKMRGRWVGPLLRGKHVAMYGDKRQPPSGSSDGGLPQSQVDESRLAGQARVEAGHRAIERGEGERA